MYKEQIELHIHVVEWLMKNGVPFVSAMAIVSFSIKMDMSIPESYVELASELSKIQDYVVLKKDTNKENYDTKIFDNDKNNKYK